MSRTSLPDLRTWAVWSLSRGFRRRRWYRGKPEDQSAGCRRVGSLFDRSPPPADDVGRRARNILRLTVSYLKYISARSARYRLAGACRYAAGGGQFLRRRGGLVAGYGGGGVERSIISGGFLDEETCQSVATRPCHSLSLCQPRPLPARSAPGLLLTYCLPHASLHLPGSHQTGIFLPVFMLYMPLFPSWAVAAAT